MKDYQNAARYYAAAFRSNNDLAKASDRYNAASCWAKMNNSDSAFRQLEKIADKGNYRDYYTIVADENFTSLHNDQRWKGIIEQVWKNRQRAVRADSQ